LNITPFPFNRNRFEDKYDSSYFIKWQFFVIKLTKNVCVYLCVCICVCVCVYWDRTWFYLYNWNLEFQEPSELKRNVQLLRILENWNNQMKWNWQEMIPAMPRPSGVPL
jgi:hypothetical protein